MPGDHYKPSNSNPSSNSHSSSRRRDRRSRSRSRSGRDPHRDSRPRSYSRHDRARSRSHSPPRSSRYCRDRSASYSRSRSRSPRRFNQPNRNLARKRDNRSRSPLRQRRPNEYRDRSPQSDSSRSTQPPLNVAQLVSEQHNKWRYCLNCHVAHHWLKDCKDKGSKSWSCLKLIPVALCPLSEEEWREQRNIAIGHVQTLLPHIFHAIRRVNYFGAFVNRRDELLRDVTKRSCFDNSIDPSRYPLACVKNVSPYEAYVSASCKLGLLTVKKACEALEKLYISGIANIVGYPPSSNPNAALSVKEISEKVVSRITAHNQAAATGQNMQGQLQAIPNDVISQYILVLKDIWEEYTKEMDQLHLEWKELASKYQVWKEPFQEEEQVFNDLPFIEFRVRFESPDDTRISTLYYVKVEELNKYVTDMAATLRTRQLPQTAQPSTSQAAAPENEQLAALQRQVEMLTQRIASSAFPSTMAYPAYPQDPHMWNQLLGQGYPATGYPPQTQNVHQQGWQNQPHHAQPVGGFVQPPHTPVPAQPQENQQAQQLQAQQLQAQQLREQQLREQQLREQQLREQQLREQQLREQQLTAREVELQTRIAAAERAYANREAQIAALQRQTIEHAPQNQNPLEPGEH